MDRTAEQTMTPAQALASRDEVGDFLLHEADLLDEGRFEKWAELFTEDGTYWVPAAVGQSDPHHHVSLIWEDPLLRAVRVRRFRHPNAYSLQPMPRSLHIISNVRLVGPGEGGEGVLVRSRLVMFQYRRDHQDIFGARVTHHLVGSAPDFRIRHKKVELVNCDAALGPIQLYF